MADKKSGEVGKRIAFDGETWQALHRLSLDSMKSLQELARRGFWRPAEEAPSPDQS
jgi:hypothetical protein